MGVAYGAASLWQWRLHADEPGHADYFVHPGAGWREALDFEGATDVGLVGKIMRRLPFTDLQPDWTRALAGRALSARDELVVIYREGAGILPLMDGELPPYLSVLDPKDGAVVEQRRLEPRADLEYAPVKHMLANPSGQPRVYVFTRSPSTGARVADPPRVRSVAPSVPPSRGEHVQQLTPVPVAGIDGEDVSIVFANPFDPADDQRMLRNVTVPTLTAYLPEPGRGTGTGVVVAPGGGLHFLSIDNEGAWVAERLVERGIAAFVLHYRVTPTPVAEAEFAAAVQRVFTDPGYVAGISREQRAPALADGAAAVRLVRDNADAWGVARDRVGMLGFSAGAFVSLVTTLDAAAQDRPSFVAPVYPGWWDEVPVPEPAPPMFLAWATDDQLGEGIVGASVRLYDAWRHAGGSVEAHAYARGGHGFGIRSQGAPSDAWFDAFLTWLTASGF
jgi:acetyl esterase/lipase